MHGKNVIQWKKPQNVNERHLKSMRKVKKSRTELAVSYLNQCFCHWWSHGCLCISIFLLIIYQCTNYCNIHQTLIYVSENFLLAILGVNENFNLLIRQDMTINIVCKNDTFAFIHIYTHNIYKIYFIWFNNLILKNDASFS